MSEDQAWRDLFGGGQSSVGTPRAASALSRVRHEMFGASPLPSQLGHLTVLERLGHGGMGAVYGAYDPQLDRRVAVKVLHLSNAKAMKRALREGRALARVSHPNVIVVHGVELVDERVHIIMEYAPGGTLKRWLGQARTWQEIVQHFVEAGQGLAAAHAAGLVHGDFKPDNVLLGVGGVRPRVADFGLAVEDRDLQDTADGEPTTDGAATRGGGTAGYASPEQAAMASLDARSDQFSFCVALYEALHGVRPFTPQQILTQTLDPIRVGTPAGPSAVHAALLRGLSVDPAARHPSMEALLAPLQAALRPRAWRWGVVATGLLGVGLAVGGVLGREPGVDCSREPKAIRAQWEAARPGVRAAIEAVEAPGADGSWEETERSAERYLGRWGDAWSRVCSSSERVPTPENALRQDCLERVRTQFDALLEALQTLERDELPFLRFALIELMDADGCLSGAKQGWRQAAPENQAGVARARATLSRAHVAWNLARFDDALGLAVEVGRAAGRLGDGPLFAEAMHIRGMAEESLGRAAVAKQSYTDAIWAGYRSGHHFVVAGAAYHLAHLRGFREHAVDEALWWVRLGTEACAAADLSEELGADLVRVRGELAFRSGRAQDALAHLREALAIYRRVTGPRSVEVGALLQTLGSFTYASGDAEGALPIFDEALSIFEETLGLANPLSFPVQVERAELMRRMGRHDEGIAGLQAGIELATAYAGADYPFLADHYAVLTSLLIETGRIHDALAPARRAVELRNTQGIDTIQRVYDHTNVALVLESLGDLDGAEASQRAAVALGRRLGRDAGLGVATPVMSLAELLERRGSALEATEMATTAMAALEGMGDVDPEVVLATRTRAAAMARRSGEPGYSLAWMSAATADEGFGSRSALGRLKVLREIADARLAMGHVPEALLAIEASQEAAASPDVSARARAAVAVVHAEILRAQGDDPTRLAELIEQATDTYAGVTGWTAGFAERARALAEAR
ncbi:MAG: serine/threonine-protein kinase [Myxococcota bacterium]